MLIRNPKPGSLADEKPGNITFKEYDEFAGTTDVGTSTQDVINPGWLYYLLGLQGEVGELTEQCKKVFRDQGGVFGPDDKVLIYKELGDILWYLTRMASSFGYSLAKVAALNIIKLTDRMERKKIHGRGDDR